MISICIPTFNRPELLLEAVRSCLSQSYRPLEILVGDDSSATAAGWAINSVSLPKGVELHYERNHSQLGQAGNVNRLFERARGDRLVLLHDDDLLCDGGLDQLVAAWNGHPGAVCVYGIQSLIDAQGHILPAETAAWNERYTREPAYRGAQPSPLVAAVRQQVPSDGFLIATELARATRLRDERLVGQCVDADFMIRAATQASSGSFVFVDEPISLYRLTPDSIARAKDLNRREDRFFRFVQSLDGDRCVEEAKTVLLDRISEGAVLDAAMAGQRMSAIRILRSGHYSLPWADLRTAYRLASILSPWLARQVKAFMRGSKAPARMRDSTLVESSWRTRTRERSRRGSQ